MTRLSTGRSGDTLFRLVEEFDALGEHRTGTDTDAATVEWLAALLGDDLDVEVVPYEFPQFEFDTTLTADGVPLEHLPLFYEGTGTADTTEPWIVAVETISNWAAPDLPARIAEAVDRGDQALVVATRGHEGRLVAFNRPTEEGSGLPVVLVAGSDHEHLRTAHEVRLRYRASITEGHSANVVASGGTAGPEIVVTTPLTGWFTCAGERGPGIVLAADLATRLSTHARVTLVAASGHELHHIGARSWLDGRGSSCQPDAVVHLGASIATGRPVAPFTGERVLTCLPARADDAIAAVYDGADQSFVGRPDRWVSEAKEWLDRTERLLSFSGSFPLFHTPADRVHAATSPARLHAAADRLDQAAAVLLETCATEVPRTSS